MSLAQRTFSGTRKVSTISGTLSGVRAGGFRQMTALLFGFGALAGSLQINAQLLCLLVKMTALQSQGFGGVGDVKLVAPQFGQDSLPLKIVHALGQGARCAGC